MGVDPGTRVLGWGVVELDGASLSLVGCGALHAPREARTVPERLAAIVEAVAETV